MCGKVSHLVQRSLVDEPPIPKDSNAVANCLHLAENVRGEEDRLAALLGFVDALPKRHLHQRVKSGCRLVEDKQVGATGQGGDELHLLAVALESARTFFEVSSLKRSTSRSR